MTDLSLEHNLQTQGYKAIAGVDEVGRGPWAGPVVAAAVILHAGAQAALTGVTDSKKLTAAKRESLVTAIKANSTWALGEASVAEIDTLNIRNATFLAMHRAVENLPAAADFALIDGNAIPPNLSIPAQSVIKGDLHSLSIAAASIIAKVYRDAFMADLHQNFPHFGWNTNAGYGTKVHQQGLAHVGVTEHHRRSFKPIQVLLDAATKSA